MNHYRGITASPGCVLVQGFPLNEQLHQLRENLRRIFRDSSLHSTIDSRYKIATAHSTIARFQAPLRNHSELLKLLEQYRTYDFGVSRIHHLDLVFNNCRIPTPSRNIHWRKQGKFTVAKLSY